MAPLAGVGPPPPLPVGATAWVVGVDAEPRPCRSGRDQVRDELVVRLPRQAAPPLVEGHPEVHQLVSPGRGEPGDLVATEDDEAVDGRVVDLRAPPVRQHVVRKGVLVLGEHPGQAGDRCGLLDGHHGRYVLGPHRPQHPAALHGSRLGHG